MKWKLKEIFVPILGYKGKYSISNHGRVKNNKKDNFLKQHKNPNGYYFVQLRNNGNVEINYIHRLVLRYFIKKHGKSECNHIDGVKTNNYVENLEYVTHEENIQHAIRMGLINGKFTREYLVKFPFGINIVMCGLKELYNNNNLIQNHFNNLENGGERIPRWRECKIYERINIDKEIKDLKKIIRSIENSTFR